MNKKIKIILPLVACVVTLASCNRGGGESGSSYVSGSSQSHDPEAFNGYYKGYEIDNVGSSTLQFNLHKLCLDKHTKVVKYQQYKTYNSTTTKPRPVDCDPNDNSKIVLFYTGKSVAPSDGSWNREHVWPCANSGQLWVHSNYTSKEYYVDDSNYWGGGSDLYNVRPATAKVNTARGNSKYIEFNEGDKYYESTDGGPYALKVNSDPNQGFATKCEPADQVKGDIVRSLMYTYIHYNKFGSYNWYYDEPANTKCVMGSLQLNNVFGYDNMDKIYEVISKWNKLDPVDDLERLRNDTIQAIQGNRNPFVDYPDLIDACFGL